MQTREQEEMLATGLRLYFGTKCGPDGFDSSTAGLTCQPLQSDGSTRRFLRVGLPDGTKIIIVAPGIPGTQECAEARSGWLIGTHLLGKRLQVPDLYGWDEPSGTLVFADLGDTRLHDFWSDTGRDAEEKYHYYRLAIELLVRLQIEGGNGLESSWCWDTPEYDERVMLDKEAFYFYRALWCNLLEQPASPKLEEDLADLVKQAATIPRDYFLHRDFQSRNLMIKDNKVYAIDYQAGRFGPLGYDLASLLIDPYAILPLSVQEELFSFYLQLLRKKIEIDESGFRRQYRQLAMQRNLQILGAFAFLSKVRGKRFFSRYIEPAARMLQERLADQLFSDYSVLRDTSAKILNLIDNSGFAR